MLVPPGILSAQHFGCQRRLLLPAQQQIVDHILEHHAGTSPHFATCASLPAVEGYQRTIRGRCGASKKKFWESLIGLGPRAGLFR